MRRWSFALIVVLLLVSTHAVWAAESGKAPKAEEKRQKIDGMARETLERLSSAKPASRELYDSAYGYAVFDNFKLSLVITGGGGVGVAVQKGTGERTYMKMGTGGVNLGLGGQKYQVVFLFETQKTFDNFVQKGWQADAGANAVAWKSGANAEASFVSGIAVYQLTEAGLMLQADLSGTKYWKSKKLNR